MKPRVWPFKDPAGCPHEQLTWGCQGCIDRNRLGVLKAYWLSGEAVIPNCEECGRLCVLGEADVKSMTLSFWCTQIIMPDGEGCGDEITVKVQS